MLNQIVICAWLSDSETHIFSVMNLILLMLDLVTADIGLP